jgi:hypothetical protein
MELPRPEIVVNGILRHTYKYVFRLFEPIRPILALKLAKSTNESKKIIF